jgi:phosphate/sulfate permease
MEFFQIAILILFGLAISDLIVGVSNDAVNFLNSSIGSRVAPRHIIMLIASAGILTGVTFSSGMMEVARKGIFHPGYFTMPELMTVFLAVMLTDILLLDLFNTFGLPTSTTVSIVFELLGAAVAMSIIKLSQAGSSLSNVSNYINTSSALTIISGILLSVVFAFGVGALVQYVSRIIFTFDYERRIRKYGALWGGAALASIVFFILIKGAKGASFIPPDTATWIKGNAGLILLASFFVSAILLQLLLILTRINILKIIVLVGTFALAMAFAANDLVNFIGVPLAGLSAFQEAFATAQPLTATMEALTEPVRGNTLILLVAGLIMVVTLWVSRKARSVTKTEVSLGRQDEGFERFESNVLARIIVRLVASFFNSAEKIFPPTLRRSVGRRFERSQHRPQPGSEGERPSFDLVRASVNLMVASALISLATSLKLPLSTTYVTFMVAMGTSLSDQAWGRDSAVYRVSGVLTVIGGWFFTALAAFSVSAVFATAISFGGGWAVGLILVAAVAIVVHTHFIHKEREETESSTEVFNLRKVSDSEAATRITFEHAGHFLAEVRRVLDEAYDGLIDQDRPRLRHARADQKKIQRWSNVIAANVFKVFRLLHWQDVQHTQRYAQAIGSLQEISEAIRDIVKRSKQHVENNHSALLPSQVEELRRVQASIGEILDRTATALSAKSCPDCDEIEGLNRELRLLVNSFDQHQIQRIQSNESKTRLSILFYSLVWDAAKIAEETTQLRSVLQEWITVGNGKPPADDDD